MIQQVPSLEGLRLEGAECWQLLTGQTISVLHSRVNSMLKFELGSFPTSELVSCSDEIFLQSVRWRKAVPANLAAAAKKGDVTAFAESLVSLPQCSGLFESGPWVPEVRLEATFPQPQPDRLTALADGFRSLKPRQRSVKAASDACESWLKSLTGPQDVTATECLLLWEWLPVFASRLEPVLLYRIWRMLLLATGNWSDLQSSSKDSEPANPAEQLVRIGELPWRCGLFFAEIKGAGKLAKQGMLAIVTEFEKYTDRLGTPFAEILGCLPGWLGSLTRIASAAVRLDPEAWDDDFQREFGNLVERVAPMSLPQGRLALSEQAVADPQLALELAFELSGWPDAESAQKALFSTRGKVARNGRPQRRTGQHGTAETDLYLAPSMQSDRAAIAHLRSDWSRHAELVTVSHRGSEVRLELSADGETLVSGLCQVVLTRDGTPIPLSGDWDCVCWQSDEDADYLELQQVVPGQVRIERQVFLSRSDHFCLLADSISEMKAGRIDYSLSLPLGPDVNVVADQTTREQQLHHGECFARVFPLALPQNRVESTPGSLVAAEGKLTLSQARKGTGMYVPLLLDWGSNRQNEPAQWRTLTVTEELRVLTPDTAAGYRLRLGPQHLLMYRGIVRSHEPRAVLGHQTRYETVVGSIDSEGEVTPILMVE